jgi:hypothetical protein
MKGNQSSAISNSDRQLKIRNCKFGIEENGQNRATIFCLDVQSARGKLAVCGATPIFSRSDLP